MNLQLWQINNNTEIELGLWNPDVDWKVLSSTIAWARTWITPAWWWISNLDWWTSNSLYNNTEDIDWWNSL